MSDITKKKFEEKKEVIPLAEYMRRRPEEAEAIIRRARKEEQRVKGELESELKEIRKFLRGELKNAIGSEFRDSKRYDHLAEQAELLDWTPEAKVLREMANDERRHRKELESIWFRYFKVK